MPVPITAALAALLAELKGDRPDDAPLLRKSDGSRWLEINKSEHWNLFRAVAERAGFDPDVITSYALRHSSICRALLNGVPVSVVGEAARYVQRRDRGALRGVYPRRGR